MRVNEECVNLDDILFEHLAVEFMNHNEMVFESNGTIPMLSEYVSAFINNALAPLYKRMIDNKDTVVYQRFDKEIFSDISEPFFTHIEIDLTIGIGDRTEYHGGYLPLKSCYSDLIKFPHIELTVSAPTKKELFDAIRFTFSHELTHAYDDCRRSMRYGTIVSKMDIDASANHYYNTINMRFGDNLHDGVCGILNNLSKMELNAFIGQFRAEIEPQADKMINIYSAYDIARNTNAWAHYETLKKNVETLMSITDREYQKDILDAFNEVSEKGFERYGEVKRFLKENFYRWQKKFINTISKTIYDVYAEHTGPRIN